MPKQIWELIMAILLIYVVIFVPWRIAFETLHFWDAWTTLEIFIDFLLFIDVIIN